MTDNEPAGLLTEARQALAMVVCHNRPLITRLADALYRADRNMLTAGDLLDHVGEMLSLVMDTPHDRQLNNEVVRSIRSYGRSLRDAAPSNVESVRVPLLPNASDRLGLGGHRR
ncbi:MAG: hypothetical protein M3Y35_04005 [Actinomycetota bacterium]|nr:hypothetical protein [Actinomycetota bacterium]